MKFVDFEDARARDGLRMVVVPGVPSPWGEAAKGILFVKKIPYVAVRLDTSNGALVELRDGSVKWDMITGIGVHFFGHSDPDLIRAALEAALDDTVKHGNLQSNFDGYHFSEVLLEQISCHSFRENVKAKFAMY